MQNRQLVNTPTDSTATLILKPLTHSEMNSTGGTDNASERLQQWEMCQNGNGTSATVANLQTSQGHHTHNIHSNEPKEQQENSNVSQSLKKGLEHNSDDDISRKDSHLNEEVSPPPKVPVDHGAMVDMKVVKNRHTLMSHVSLRQKNSPRTQDKNGATHDGNVDLNLQIEGQAMKLSSENSVQRRNKLNTTQKEYYKASSSQSHAVRQESEKGSLTSLSIKPVSLQQLSRKVSAGAAPVKENDRNADVEQSTCMETLEDTTCTAAQLQETDGGTHFDGNTTGNDSHSTQEENDSTSKSQGSDCQPPSTVDLLSIEHENDKASGLNNKENSTADETKEKSTVTSDNALHAMPGGSTAVARELPIVFVRESSPAPARPYSMRPSSSHQKSLSLRYKSTLHPLCECCTHEHTCTMTIGFLHQLK